MERIYQYCQWTTKHLSEDFSDEVDVGPAAGQHPPHHLHVGQLLLIHGAEGGGAGFPFCQRRRVGVALLWFATEGRTPRQPNAASAWSRRAAATFQVGVGTRAAATAAVLGAACGSSCQTGCCSLGEKTQYIVGTHVLPFPRIACRRVIFILKCYCWKMSSCVYHKFIQKFQKVYVNESLTTSPEINY